jgi:hypothetical protein
VVKRALTMLQILCWVPHKTPNHSFFNALFNVR